MVTSRVGRTHARLWPIRFGARQVLLAGFGGLLILMALAGADALSVLARLRTTNAEIRQMFLRRNAALDRIRSGIYLSGTYARDYLLAPEQAGAELQRQRLRAMEQDTRAAMDEYAHLIDSSEESTFADLRGEITAYWKLLDFVLDWSSPEKRRRGYAFFYNDLIHRRSAMLGIADRISAMNARELSAGDQRISREFGRFRLSLAVTLLVTLAGGLLLAAVATRHLLRLEGEARARYEESVRAQAELKELSARLVSAQEEERKAIARELHDEVGQIALCVAGRNRKCNGDAASGSGRDPASYRVYQKAGGEQRSGDSQYVSAAAALHAG